MSPEHTTLAEAKDWLRDRVDDGDRCPCCTQFAKVYRRKIHATMARDFLRIYTGTGGGHEWFHLPRFVANSGDVPKMRYWGLMVEETDRRDDGGRAGYWRLTDLGRAFAEGRVTVAKYARIYDGRCLGLDGDPVSIRDALGSRFDYAELMSDHHEHEQEAA